MICLLNQIAIYAPRRARELGSCDPRAFTLSWSHTREKESTNGGVCTGAKSHYTVRSPLRYRILATISLLAMFRGEQFTATLEAFSLLCYSSGLIKHLSGVIWSHDAQRKYVWKLSVLQFNKTKFTYKNNICSECVIRVCSCHKCRARCSR